MCSNENLFDFMSEKCPLTNMFLAFKMNLQSEQLDFPAIHNLTPKMNFEKWPKRSKICHFTFQPREKCDTKMKLPASVTGIDIYTPTAMQMCTPYADTKFARKRPFSGSLVVEEDEMIETPIQETKILNITHAIDEIELSSPWTWFYSDSVLKGFRDPQVIQQSWNDIFIFFIKRSIKKGGRIKCLAIYIFSSFFSADATVVVSTRVVLHKLSKSL